jgi:hypothetical protein
LYYNLALATRSYFTPFDRKSEDGNFLPSEKTNRQKEERTGEYTVSLSLSISQTQTNKTVCHSREFARFISALEKGRKKKTASQDGRSASPPSFLSLSHTAACRSGGFAHFISPTLTHTGVGAQVLSLSFTHTHTQTHARVCAT